MVIDAEPDADDIVNAIKRKQCQPFGKAIPVAVRLKREISVLRKRFRLQENHRENTEAKRQRQSR